MKKIVFNRLLFIFLFLGFQGAVLAQDESLSDPTKSLECLITTDFYIVHLTSYQEPKDADSKRHKFKPFCQELPEQGPSFLAIDFIDRDLRKMPIGMRVVEEIESAEDGGEMTDGATIAEIPAQLYKTGVAQIQADFPKPGRYALIVTVGDDMFADKIRIPLRVGIGSLFSWTSLLPYLILILVAAIGYGIYRHFVYRYNRKKRNQGNNI